MYPHFNFKKKSVFKMVRKHVFAIDSSLVAHTPIDLQTLVNKIATAAKHFRF